MSQITYIKGDLLDFPNDIDVLHHGCNIHGTMGAGIALQIAKRYPEAARVDKICHEAGTNKLGTCSVADIGKGKKIINLYQQTLNPDENGKSLDFDALYSSMLQAVDYLNGYYCDERRNPDPSISRIKLGFPKGLGSGLAVGCRQGFDPYIWNIVEAMIKATFGRNNYDIVIVEFDPNA